MRTLILITATLISACSAATAKPLNVVTDIPPVHSLVAMVMGGRGDPILLLSGAEDPHHFQLRPSQVRSLSNADLVFWIGEDLTPWLATTLEANTTDTTQVELLPHADANPNAHTVEPTGDHDDHHHRIDPHAWLNPDNALVWLQVISTALRQADPENAEIYAANAREAQNAIQSLSKLVASQLTEFQAIPAIALHDAFGHFEARFDVAFAGFLKDSDASAASVGRLSDLYSLIEAEKVLCIFAEPQRNPVALQILADEFDLTFHQLDLLGATLEPGPDLYGTLLGNLSDSIVTCVARQSN